MFLFNQKPNIQENISLANHTTFRLGGPARYFCEVKNSRELIWVIKWARKKGLPFFVFGGGSNLLASDEGFSGLAIKMQNSKIKIQNDPLRQSSSEASNEKCKIECDAGVPFAKIILESTRIGYSGLEWGFGIPGTVGGAIFGNSGRLGQDVSQIVESVSILDFDSLKKKVILGKDCGFAYRESRFKKGDSVILDVVFKFKKGEKEEIEKILAEAKEVVRNSPPWPSAGCAFKNYQVKSENDILLKHYPELIQKVRGGKIGVGFLIDQCGLLGRQIGGARIWEGHANYIVNIGGAKTRDVLEIIELVKKAVKEKFGIELEEEIRRLNC